MILRRGCKADASPSLAGLRPSAYTRRAGDAAAAWARAASAIGRHTCGHGQGAAAAADLLTNQLAGSTRDTYATKWVAFVDFCQANGYPSLPTTTEVVACYIGGLDERGTVAPGTVQKYPTPIHSVHAFLQLPKPAVKPRLAAVRHSFAHKHANENGVLRHCRPPSC